MALPPGAIGSAVREKKLACCARTVKSAFPICSSAIECSQRSPGLLSRAFGFKVTVGWPTTTC
jgi:hypothetical protein